VKIINKWIQEEPLLDPSPFDPFIDQLGYIRGIEDFDQYCKPTKESLYNPYLLENIQKVANIIDKAIDDDINICISGDADSDGLTSLAILYRYLNKFTTKLSYIYNQRSQGHGISNQVVPDNTNLLIIVDSSTNETEVCKEISERGIQIVILDHHPRTQDNPYAIIVNPQLDHYPNKELSGAGVVFKFIQVLDDLWGVDYSDEFQDLCGIGLLGDVMSMQTPENRYFVYQALHNIRNPGIKAILKKQNTIYDTMNSQTISFSIVPVINASTRMEKIELVIALLLENDENKCLELAKECVSLNTDRKNKEQKFFKKVKDRIDNNHKIIILITEEKDKIDKGFQGLLAAKICDYFKKCTLVLKENEGLCSGSGRGMGNIQFKELLEESGLCNMLQGHSQAFGCDLKTKNIEKLLLWFDENLKETEDYKEIKYIDELESDEITFDLVKEIESFNYITGKRVEPVKFVINSLEVKERKVLGKILDTVKFTTKQGIDCLKFKVNDTYASGIKEGDIIDVIGKIGINKFYNFGLKKMVTSIQCLIDDYRLVNK